MQPETQAGERGAAAAVPRAAPSILVVDDEAPNITALEEVLLPLGARVVGARSGEDALRKLLREEFALILMDVQMPGLDGFETASLIKRHGRKQNIPIIFVTDTSHDVAHVFKGYSRGGVDYLLKPVDPAILRAKASVFVELFCQREEIRRQAELLRQAEREHLERVSARTLAESEERYRYLVRALAPIVWTANARGELTQESASWTAFTGQTAAEYVGAGWLDAVHPDDREAARAGWAAAVAGAERYAAEYRLRRRDGTYAFMAVSAVPVPTRNGTVREWIGADADITARKASEAERDQILEREREAREAAQEAVRIRDEFLSIASHELNTPLTPLKLQVSMMKRTLGEDDELLPRVETVERQVDRMAKLVSQLLDVSRIAVGRLALERERVDVAMLVREVAARFPTEDVRGGSELVVSLPDGPCMGWLDRLRTEQVVVNLLTNAFKYGGAKPVEIALEVSSAVATLRVRDDGIGIDAEAQARIFERFERAVSAQHYGGFGLGLWIARQIVEASGGSIAVNSTKGAGSCFTVKLPLGEEGSLP